MTNSLIAVAAPVRDGARRASELSADERQLAALIADHRQALMDHAARLTAGDIGWAEDAVQETMVRAWKHLDRLHPELGSVRGWLMRVCHNIVMDGYRSAKCRPSTAPLDDTDDLPSIPDDTDLVLRKLQVTAVLALVEEPHRTALVATYLHDRTAAEAASALGVPVGTVKSRVHYGLRSLRAALESRGVGAETLRDAAA